MERKVPAEIRMYQRQPAVHGASRRIVCLHTSVKSEYQESEIKSDSESVLDGYLLVK